VALLVAGALVQAFVRFVVEGVGTPAPVAPTEHLLVGGLYRHVRNPMYLAVLTMIVGQALVLGQPALLLYTVAVGAAFATFVRWYEEPALRRRFGEEYEVGRRSPLGARLELHGCSDRLPGRLEDGESLVARARVCLCNNVAGTTATRRT
jgi:uncharacterized membrane protein